MTNKNNQRYNHFLSYFSNYALILDVINKNLLTRQQLKEIVAWLEQLKPKVEFLDNTLKPENFEYGKKWTELFCFEYIFEYSNVHSIKVLFSANNTYGHEEYSFSINERKLVKSSSVIVNLKLQIFVMIMMDVI